MENLEDFVPIKGYEKRYEINRNGIIKKVFNSNRKNVFLKKYIRRDGYLSVNLFEENGRKKNFLHHRLVALTFIANLENKPTVNHINGIKSDNRVENLEWCTKDENNKHAIDNNINTNRKVLCKNSGIIYDSIVQASKASGIDRRRLNKILVGEIENKSNLILL